MTTPTVVAVCGSRREGSYTRRALRHVTGAAREAGARTRFVDLGGLEVPLYHPDRDPPPVVEEAMATVREAEGVVLGSPVYHDSYSSTLKNFHDFCGHDEYEDTVVGLLAVAGGSNYASTLEHMRITVRGVHGLVIPHQVGISGGYDAFEGGEIVDEDLAERVETLGREVVAHAEAHAISGERP